MTPISEPDRGLDNPLDLVSQGNPEETSVGSQKEADIYIVGLGISVADHLTREAERVMRRSNEIMYVETGVGIGKFLSSFCDKVTNLTVAYTENQDRQRAYHEMAARVVQAALENPPVSFALYGHPTIFAYPPFLIQELARHLNLHVVVVPGISAMDCIFKELMVDPATNGLQLFEATEMLVRQRPLQPDVAALIWQIGALETGLYSNRPSKPNRFTRFKAHLMQFYPATHEIFAVHCSNYPLLELQTLKFPISQIDIYAPALHSGFTLYIPPAFVRPILDDLPIELKQVAQSQREAAGRDLHRLAWCLS